MTPNGLKYIPDFISNEEEAKLIGAIDNAAWQTDLKRRVQHHGWRYDYRTRNVKPSDYLGPLPAWLDQVVARLAQCERYMPQPEQAIVNEYVPGQGISAHIDCVQCFGPVVASLSLGSDCEMQFENRQAHMRIRMLIRRKSLLILTDQARYEWHHGIAARKSDPAPGPEPRKRSKRYRRISVTFRTIL